MPGIFANYHPAPGAYDEVIDAAGAPRPHWRDYESALTRFDPDDLRQRWDQAAEQIEEDGVTYTVYSGAHGITRPWAMDGIPLVIPPDEWATIEKGLIQRATLLNAVLADIYGPQSLLIDGALPPEFLFANPRFLRPVHGMRPPEGRYLHLYAADLARGPDGRWTVLADRTQAPSGAGYALENRIVMARAFLEVFRACGVGRLAAFFDRLRDGMRELGLRRRDTPNIVLLTPGPRHESYFEHAYLARFLGFPLVEGEDLSVRDSKVYLKTLEGLEPVDVILRRVDDFRCDPLEFYRDSGEGPPGLVAAGFAGNVAVANGLGSGVLEAPALRAVLPGLCERVLQQDLVLPSVTTTWLGEKADLSPLARHPSRYLVAEAFPERGWSPIALDKLPHQQRAELLARIENRPYVYVAQERIVPSTAPVWVGQTLEPRHIVVRCYAVASSDGSYTVMPGGLARFSDSPDWLVISMQSGGGSKDTWVPTQAPPTAPSLLEVLGRGLAITRATANLPSRAADNLFWMGRYLERAEAAARAIRCILTRVTDEMSPTGSRDLARLLPLLGPAPSATEVSAERVEREAHSAVFDESRPGSVQSLLNELRRVALGVRDRLSADTWRVVNWVLDELPEAQAGGLDDSAGEILVVLNRLMTQLAAFSGLAMENMTRGHGWRFLDLGRRIERAIQMLNLLRLELTWAVKPEGPMLLAVLEIADSAMTYRARYGPHFQAAPTLDLLLADASNPRSVLFQAEAVGAHLEALPQQATGPVVTPEQRLAEQAMSELRMFDALAACEPDSNGFRSRLDAILDRVARLMPEISDALARRYFTHTERSKQVERLENGGAA